jgi:hypothetical protein
MNGCQKMKCLTKGLILFLALFSAANSQELDTLNKLDTIDVMEYKIKPERLAIIGGTVGAFYTAAFVIFLKDGWWKKYEPFSFEDRHHDWDYVKNMDKFGHFYAGVLLGDIFAMSYDWAGMSPFASVLWAGITIGSTQILIELKDGFSAYGYSIYDAMAGTLGGFYAMGKRYIPAMQYIDVKLSYYPNSSVYWDGIRKNGGEDQDKGNTGGKGVPFDDYYNQTYWLSFKVAKMLPSGAREYYPEWLGWAFGMGINDWDYAKGYDYYFSMDYDFEAILKPKQTWTKNLATILNHIKFPAPAVRLGSNAKFFPLHPWYGFSTNF